MTHLLPANWPELSPHTIARLAPLQPIQHSVFAKANIQVFIKREDLLHPILGGNKVYKLFGHLAQWRERDKRALASFGGAYSNHLLALAAAGAAINCPTWGVVRGERPARLSATLVDAQRFGMQLHFISREDYRQRHCPDMLASLSRTLGDVHWVPEGGAGLPGLLGCQALAHELTKMAALDCLCHASGTGASLAGLAAGVASGVSVLGVPVLKGDTHKLHSDIAAWLREAGFDKRDNWRLVEGFHGGGYAKLSPELMDFMREFYRDTGVPLDAVYTAKLMWAVLSLAEQGYWPENSRIGLIHSGGLQGNRGFPHLSLV